MAGSSEGDLLTNIGIQINEFSGNTQYADNIGGRAIPTLESTLQLAKQTEVELRQMDHQIQDLERKLKIRQLDKKRQLKLLNDKERIALSSEREPGDVKKEVQVLEKELQLLKDITGVHITKTECNVIDIEKSFLERSYCVDGSCKGVIFQMAFTVKETWEKINESVSKIEGLSIKFSDEVCEETLRPVIQVLEAGGSVTLLLHVVAAFGDWRKQRADLVSRVCQMYPDMAEVNTDDQLVITPTSFTSSEFVFDWQLVYSECYKASSRINLVVKVPKDVNDLDGNEVLRSAPSMFNKMQDTLGSGRALETILKTLCS